MSSRASGRPAVVRRIPRLTCSGFGGLSCGEGIRPLSAACATRASASKLLHRVVHGREELPHRRLRLVTHVRDAEGGAFNLAVAAVDEEALVFRQLDRKS